MNEPPNNHVPPFPVKIYARILEFVEGARSVEPREGRWTGSWARTLSCCALVCRAWHKLVIQHTFLSITVDVDSEDEQAARGLHRVLKLMNGNSEISSSIQQMMVACSSDAYSNSWGSALSRQMALPWSLFIHLSSLHIALHLTLPRMDPDDEMHIWPHAPTELIEFPAHCSALPHLFRLSVDYSFSGAIFGNDDVVQCAMEDILAHSLDPYFVGEGFRALEDFSLEALKMSRAVTLTTPACKDMIRRCLPVIIARATRVSISPHMKIFTIRSDSPVSPVAPWEVLRGL